jgi:hypothetical protein
MARIEVLIELVKLLMAKIERIESMVDELDNRL